MAPSLPPFLPPSLLRFHLPHHSTLLFTPPFPPSLQTNGRLMELSHHDGKLRVHYSDRLVTLLREVRQLAALGFLVPAKIQHTANTAQRFYRHGVVLKQVAHFYNTIDQQMVPSQQAMMLDAALAFEHIIKNPRVGSSKKSGTEVHKPPVLTDVSVILFGFL